jgi:hypothetical protein
VIPQLRGGLLAKLTHPASPHANPWGQVPSAGMGGLRAPRVSWGWISCFGVVVSTVSCHQPYRDRMGVPWVATGLEGPGMMLALSGKSIRE